jgi:Iron-containing redox enzyme
VPVQAKLEMARNFWDEMGRGSEKGMHGPMLARLADHFEISPTPDTVVPESLALGNTMIALANHRRYAFQSVGALGVIEMTEAWNLEVLRPLVVEDPRRARASTAANLA